MYIYINTQTHATTRNHKMATQKSHTAKETLKTLKADITKFVNAAGEKCMLKISHVKDFLHAEYSALKAEGHKITKEIHQRAIEIFKKLRPYIAVFVHELSNLEEIIGRVVKTTIKDALKVWRGQTDRDHTMNAALAAHFNS